MTNAAGPTLPAESIPVPSGHAQAGGKAGARWAQKLSQHALLLIQGVALVLALLAAAECHAIVTQSVPNAPLLPSLLYGLVLWYWWGLVATALWALARKSGKGFFSLGSACQHAGMSALVAGAHVWVLQRTVERLALQWPVLGPAGYSSLHYLNLNRFVFEFLLYGFLFGLTGVIQLQLASQRDTLRALSLERQLSMAHLQALQMQMEPHFLFNTLNAITSLVEQDRKEQALQTLQNLNSILKITLRRGAPEKVSLAQELELVDDYLSIEVTRFADRLQVEMSIDPGSLHARLPCFLLQPIVENAIRHGISRCEQNGLIELRAEHKEARLFLTVRNTGPARHAPLQPGHGIGLQNTQKRLALFYGDDYEFRAGALPSGGFEVCIGIPYERGGP